MALEAGLAVGVTVAISVTFREAAGASSHLVATTEGSNVAIFHTVSFSGSVPFIVKAAPCSRRVTEESRSCAVPARAFSGNRDLSGNESKYSCADDSFGEHGMI